jgi:hypothetical protein
VCSDESKSVDSIVMIAIQINAGTHCFHAPFGNQRRVVCSASIVDSGNVPGLPTPARNSVLHA